MILTFKDGKTLNIDSAQESLSRDKKSFMLILFSKDMSISITELVSLFSTDNMSEITITSNDGKYTETHTNYTQLVTLQKRLDDYTKGYDIRLGDAMYNDGAIE